MRRAAGVVLAALVLAPASAGASANRPPLALTATPTRVSLTGSSEATIRVTNPGALPVVVDVARAGFSLDLRGRPKVLPRGGLRTATGWLTVRPARLRLPAGATRPLSVASRLPARAEPGDHDALVLLTTRPRPGAGVAVRMRIGVVVVVRAPGRVVRRLAVAGLRVRKRRAARTLELVVVNRGNVTETLRRRSVLVTLVRGSSRVRLRGVPRELRPRSRGIVEIPVRGRMRGWVTARVDLAPDGGGPSVRRGFRVKL
jgi:hypothetical protein